MPVIPVNWVVDKKKNNRKKWWAEEEERHKGSLTKKKIHRRALQKGGGNQLRLIGTLGNEKSSQQKMTPKLCFLARAKNAKLSKNFETKMCWPFFLRQNFYLAGLNRLCVSLPRVVATLSICSQLTKDENLFSVKIDFFTCYSGIYDTLLLHR
jgi:hypothetical protein